MGISQVHLVNFRNYKNLKLECNPNSNIVIFGNNGAGKTNLLEAISLFAPGRGIKSSNYDELLMFGAKEFSIGINIISDIKSNIKIFLQDKKKRIEIDNKKSFSSAELVSIVKIMWFTPQMNTIFSGEKSIRRRFFDRIVANFFTTHIENLLQYEHLKSERIKLLKSKIFDNVWLNNLEKLMAESGIKIALKRLEALNILQNNIDAQKSNFLKSTLIIDGYIEKLLVKVDIEEVQNIFAKKLKLSRDTDSIIKKTTFGIHLSDFYSIHREKKIKSSLCSTGEQKLLLLSIILSAIAENSVLLLDDIVEHIDHDNYILLMQEILQKKCQIWISSVNYEKFYAQKEHFALYKLNQGLLYKL